MTGTSCGSAWATIGAGRRAVDRVEHEDVGAVGERGLGLDCCSAASWSALL